MFYNITTEEGWSFSINSTSESLSELKTELAAVTFGYIDADGKVLIGIDKIKKSVITLDNSRNTPL
jgi:hypothetical protein